MSLFVLGTPTFAMGSEPQPEAARPSSAAQRTAASAVTCPTHTSALPWAGQERMSIIDLPQEEGGDLALVVTQPDDRQVRVDWRFVAAGTTLQPGIGACIGPTPARTGTSAPFADNILISLLVDDSKSMGDTLKPQADFIKQLLAAAAKGSSVRFALTLLSSAPGEKVALGGTAEAISREISGLRPAGKTTELFLSVRDAIRRISAQRREQNMPDSRAFVLVFSDGRAEDKGYTYEDVRKVALEEGVAVYTFGYPGGKGSGLGGVPQPELQILRRLAEDTGGVFFGASAEHQFPDASSLLTALSNGGSKTFRLPAADSADAASRKQTLNVIVAAAADKAVAFPVMLPSAVPPDPYPTIDWGRIAAIGAAVLAGILVGLLLLLIWSRQIMKRMAQPVSAAPQAGAPLRGFRVYRPGAQEPPRWFVDHASIGSGPNNDVVVADEELAMRAAVISRDGGGEFRLQPESASTEARLNGRNTGEVAPLHDGDLIQLGEAKFRFVSDTPTEALPKPLRRLAIKEEREAEKEHDPSLRSRVEEWWPWLAVRWPTLARYWARIAPRLKKRGGVVYRVLSTRLARLAEGEEFDFFSINVLIFVAIQVLSVFFVDDSEDDPEDVVTVGDGSMPVAFLDVLKRIPGMEKTNRRFAMQGNRCRIRRRREPDYIPEEDLLLYDDTVSREPLVVIERRQPGHFVIQDHGATNRVLVNNRPVVHETALEDGAIIDVGAVPIRFLQLA